MSFFLDQEALESGHASDGGTSVDDSGEDSNRSLEIPYAGARKRSHALTPSMFTDRDSELESNSEGEDSARRKAHIGSKDSHSDSVLGELKKTNALPYGVD